MTRPALILAITAMLAMMLTIVIAYEASARPLHEPDRPYHDSNRIIR